MTYDATAHKFVKTVKKVRVIKGTYTGGDGEADIVTLVPCDCGGLMGLPLYNSATGKPYYNTASGLPLFRRRGLGRGVFRYHVGGLRGGPDAGRRLELLDALGKPYGTWSIGWWQITGSRSWWDSEWMKNKNPRPLRWVFHSRRRGV